MGTIITLASQKGGVGKTTSAVNLAASLALAEKRVLLLDFDPQGNASSGVGSPAEHDGAGLLSFGLQQNNLSELIHETSFANLLVVQSSSDLARLELIQQAQGPSLPAFRSHVRRLREEFDFVLFDCPPSLGGLPTIALSCSDFVLIPVQCEYYAMEGLSQILPVIQQLREVNNLDLKIGGLLLTMFSDRLELSHEVAREVRGYFQDEVFDAVIPRDVILAEASSHGLPVYHYDPLSRGAWSYVELAKEVLDHGWA